MHFAWRASGRGVFGVEFSLGTSWAAWVAAMALVIAVSHASYRWIEEPARYWLRRRALAGSAPARNPLQLAEAPQPLR